MPETNLRPIQTAEAYLAKYDLAATHGTVDEDPLAEGLQNTQFDAAGATRDYATLSAEQRYHVFVHLKARGDSELLRELIGFHAHTPEIRKWGVHHYINKELGTFRRSDTKSDQWIFDKGRAQQRLDQTMRAGRTDIWQARLVIAEEQFILGELLADDLLLVSGGLVGEGDGTHSASWEDHANARGSVRDSLIGLYKTYWPDRTASARGNPLWDSDTDGYFDHDDPQPMEPNRGRRAAVPANVCGHTFASPEKIAAAWQQIPVGKTLTNGIISATRTGKQRIRLSFDIPIYVEESCRKFATPTALAQLARRTEQAFEKAIAKGAVHFDIRVQFRAVTDPDQAAARFNSGERSNSENWHPDALMQKNGIIAAHEAGHLVLQYGDYYHELFSDGQIRDRSLTPGFAVLGKFMNHLMAQGQGSTKATLTQHDLLAVVADIVEPPAPGTAHTHGAAKAADAPEPTEDVVVVLPPARAQVESRVQDLLRHGETQQARALLLRIAHDYRDDPDVVLHAVQLLHYYVGDSGAALRIMEERYQHTHDRQAALYMAQVLHSAGHDVEAVAIVKDALQHHPDDMMLIRTYADLTKDPEHTLIGYRQQLQRTPDDLRTAALYITSLYSAHKTAEAGNALRFLTRMGGYKESKSTATPEEFGRVTYILRTVGPELHQAVCRLWKETLGESQRAYLLAIADALGVQLPPLHPPQSHHQRETR